jgi:tripartite-type tricarboxylate transporter receptor subunit TctC
MKPTRSWFAAGFLALFAAAGAMDRPANAPETIPARAVKLVVPYAPGGPNDIVARILAQKLAEALGGQFVVENTVGAGGTIGTATAANAQVMAHAAGGKPGSHRAADHQGASALRSVQELCRSRSS